MKWPDHDEPPSCARLHAWMNRQDAQTFSADAQTDVDRQQLIDATSESLLKARRPLIWLESVDVRTARAAVQLADISGATLHVAQSPGAECAERVTCADGWLGSTLAEVGSTATLVIHVGQQHLRSAPMFELRYVNSAAEHLFLESCSESLLADPELAESIVQLHWSKETWLDRLTRTLLVLRDESAALARRAEAIDVEAGMLAEMLLGSRYTTIIWSEDELSDELDELIVSRLFEIAQQVNRTSRCSLLALAQDPGRVTAKDCILWLTNRTSPVRLVNGVWTKELLLHRSLQSWQQAFDCIVCVRNLPSDRPLPELRFDLVLDAWCNTPSYANESSDSNRLAVRAVGLDADGHLLRSDHGLAAYLPALDSNTDSKLPHAIDLMMHLANRYDVKRTLASSTNNIKDAMAPAKTTGKVTP